MRQKLVEADLVECVLGLGPNLFYNSPMEACVLVCRTKKPEARRGRILFIDAIGEVSRERAQSSLLSEHIARILGAYGSFAEEAGFAAVATRAQVAAQGYSLSIPLFVKQHGQAPQDGEKRTVAAAWAEFEDSGRMFWLEMHAVVEMLDGLLGSEGSYA